MSISTATTESAPSTAASGQRPDTSTALMRAMLTAYSSGDSLSSGSGSRAWLGTTLNSMPDSAKSSRLLGEADARTSGRIVRYRVIFSTPF
jgi:hypothetical protein